MWDLPGPGVGPVSPESVGGFFTTKEAGKHVLIDFLHVIIFTQQKKSRQVKVIYKVIIANSQQNY